MPGPYDPQYSTIRQKIAAYAQKYGIDPDLAIWQLWTENGFKSSGCSGAGACGIAQFMPATAQRFGVNRNDVDSSLEGYGKYMAWLRNFFGGDMTKAVAAYNAGEGNIQKGRYPTETRNYVAVIASGLRSIGKSIIDAPAGAYTGADVGGGFSGVGDVFGLGQVKDYFFGETIATGPERFQGFLNTRTVTPQNRKLIATAIVIIVLIFAWREF